MSEENPKIKYIELVVRRRELLMHKSEIQKELDGIKYVIEQFIGRGKYEELVKSDRKRNLKQYR